MFTRLNTCLHIMTTVKMFSFISYIYEQQSLSLFINFVSIKTYFVSGDQTWGSSGDTCFRKSRLDCSAIRLARLNSVLNVFFKKMGQPRPLFYFSLFKHTLQFLQLV